MSLPNDFSELEYTRARLRNWGAFYRDSVKPGTSPLYRLIKEHETPSEAHATVRIRTLDSADAERVERAVMRLPRDESELLVMYYARRFPLYKINRHRNGFLFDTRRKLELAERKLMLTIDSIN